MGQRPHAIRRSDSGFTLTELLIVIVILGVLTGIVVFAVGQFTNRGEESACKTAMKTTEVAIETYRANVGTLPPNIDPALVPAYLRTNPTTNKYTITYHLAGRAAGPGTPPVPPAIAAGGVTGDLAGGAVTEDCSA